MKYLFFSTIGNDNYGDESMASNYIEKNIGWENVELITSFPKNASRKIPNVTIGNPFRNFNYSSKLKKSFYYLGVLLIPDFFTKKIKLNSSLNNYSCFIMSGGGNLNSKYFNTIIQIYLICLLFKKNNKQIYFRPQSIGPFKGLKGIYSKIILKRILKLCDEFLVRETESEKLAKKLYNNEKIKLQIDDAWTLDMEIIKNDKLLSCLEKKCPKISISVRPWNAKEMYIDKINLIVQEARKKNYEIYFIPIAYGGDQSYIDNSFIKEKLVGQTGIYFIEDYLDLNKMNAKNIKWIISQTDICIGLSYHFNVYSKSLNKKTIALYSDNYYYIKNYGLYSLLNCPKNVKHITEINKEIINNVL